MKLNFKDIIQSHKKIPCIVIGHGISYNKYLHKIQHFKNNGYIIIDCNDWYKFNTCIPSYWVLANNMMKIDNTYNIMNKYNTNVIYADSVDFSDKNFIENNLTCNYLPYDQRHFENKKCDIPGQCCINFINERLTIQEELQNYTKFSTRYGGGDTVAVHMLALSILLGCDPIYMTGIDLDYSKGYATNVPLVYHESMSFRPYMTRILNDFTIIKNSAENIGTRIINLNNQSIFNVFETGEIQ